MPIIPKFIQKFIDPRKPSSGIQEIHRCNHCSQLVLLHKEFGVSQNATAAELPHPGGILQQKVGYYGEPYFIYDFNVLRIRQAAAEGCLLLACIEKELANASGIRDGLLCFAVSYGHDESVASQVESISLRNAETNEDEWKSESLIRLFYTPGERSESEGRSMFISSRLDFWKPINQYPGSPESLQKMASSLIECLTSHSDCQIRGEQSFMPTRIIKIKKQHGSYRAYLQYQPQPALYAALSYCWGGPQTQQTVIENVQHRTQNGMKASSLPQTIQDAIKVTFELGLRFLWIDSLCIVQDDPVDRSEQISQMSKIYGSAILTIAASRARMVEEGFLGSRYEEHLLGRHCTLPLMNQNGDIGEISAIIMPKEVNEPLDSRGWAFQERILSRRIVDFGIWSTRWICPGVITPNPYFDKGHRMMHRLEEPDTDTSMINPPPSRDALDRTWREDVEEYAARTLSNSTDRILAISGVADRFGRLYQDQYYAGHWAHSLPQDLLWKVRSPGPQQTETDAYLGPSWSWVSVIQPVSLFNGDSNTELLALFTGCDIKLEATDSPYGAVQRGSTLYIRGRMREVSWIDKSSIIEEKWRPAAPNTTFDGILETENVEFMRIGVPVEENLRCWIPLAVWVDRVQVGFEKLHSSLLPSKQVWLLELIKSMDHRESAPVGLVLQQEQSQESQGQMDRKYSRIGFFKIGVSATYPKNYADEYDFYDRFRSDQWERDAFQLQYFFEDYEEEIVGLV